MLKEAIISVVLVLAIIVGNQVTQNYTKETVREMSEQMAGLREKITKPDINQEEEKKRAEEVYQQWEKRHDKLAYFIEHDELEKVETELISIKSYMETADYEEAACELDKGIFILEHIEDKYAFNLQNIF